MTLLNTLGNAALNTAETGFPVNPVSDAKTAANAAKDAAKDANSTANAVTYVVTNAKYAAIWVGLLVLGIALILMGLSRNGVKAPIPTVMPVPV